MKVSSYNNFVHVNGNMHLLYNSFSGAYLLIKEEIANCLKNNNLEELENNHLNSWKELIDNGIIIEDQIDEFLLVNNIRFQQRYSPLYYHLTINPTMNCNLNCWYCYEDHNRSSNMRENMADKVMQHLIGHYRLTQFKYLSLGFFGGEPLLKKKILINILDRIRMFCNDNGIILNLNLTTNGTLIDEEFIGHLEGINVTCQITLDGNKNKHDTVRISRTTNKGSYDKIINNMRLLTQKLVDYNLIVRVNFDNQTLLGLTDILDDINTFPRDKVSIGLHRIWQVDDKTIDYKRLYDFIYKANERGFIVVFNPLGSVITHCCYADNYNQAVINFDGNIYKCTARAFTPANKEGWLDENGNILWDTNKLQKRMSTHAPDICEKCKLYPTCFGICSQNLMENGNSNKCRISNDIGIDNLILINFNQYLLKNKIFENKDEKSII